MWNTKDIPTAIENLKRAIEISKSNGDEKTTKYLEDLLIEKTRKIS